MHDLVERVVWNKDISHTKCVKTSELTFSFFHDQWSCIFIKTLTSSEVCAMSETMHCSDLVRTLEPALHNTRRHQLQTSSPPFQPQLPPSPVGHQRYRFLKNGGFSRRPTLCKAAHYVQSFKISIKAMTLFIDQGLQRLWSFTQSELITLRYSWGCSDLQDEDEVVHRLVAVKEVVLWHFLVLVIIFELQDDVRMFQQAQEDFLWHLSCTKGLHLWRRRKKKTRFNNALRVSDFFLIIFMIMNAETHVVTCWTSVPVARKRSVAKRSCGDIFTLNSLSVGLKAEKSCFFSLWAIFFFVLLSAVIGKNRKTWLDVLTSIVRSK